MHQSAANQNVEARYRTMLIIWCAMMMSVVMYVVTTFIVQTSEQPGAAPNQVLSFVFAGVGTFTAILSFVVRSKLLQQSVERQDMGLVQTALIIGCALSEVPAVLGIVARFILPGRDYLVLLAISALAMAFHFPRRSNLLAASYKDPSFGSGLN